MLHRRRDKSIIFTDYPEFRPNLTPAEIFEQGAFGGTYWRPIHSAVTGRDYHNVHKKYKFLSHIDENLLASKQCILSRNKYGVHSGTSLSYWETHGWIKPQDPYGWLQWYCEFYNGRRSIDDDRQIKRWLAFAGPHGRFLRRLAANIIRARTKYNDVNISPVIRQGLHHWAKVITAADVRTGRVGKK